MKHNNAPARKEDTQMSDHKKLLASLNAYQSTDVDTRPNLCGVYVNAKHEAIATDGHRMLICTHVPMPAEEGLYALDRNGFRMRHIDAPPFPDYALIWPNTKQKHVTFRLTRSYLPKNIARARDSTIPVTILPSGMIALGALQGGTALDLAYLLDLPGDCDVTVYDDRMEPIVFTSEHEGWRSVIMPLRAQLKQGGPTEWGVPLEKRTIK